MKNHVTSKLGHLTKSDEGQALVVVALGLVVLMLTAGLGVDVGYLRYEKQQMQKAADAGALAAADALIYNGQVTAAAQSDTAANGFRDGTDGTTVTVNHPPKSGPFIGNKYYVEVIVAQAQPAFFMRVGGFNSVPVSARAVGSAAGSAPGCIYALDPAVNGSFQVAGGAQISSQCGIKVNSSSPSAFDVSGGGCITNATFIGIVGGVGNDACSTPAQGSPGFVTGMTPFSDPLAGLVPPLGAGIVPSCDHAHTNVNINSGHHELDANTYCGGIRIGGSSPTVTLGPGTYILYGGGLQISTDATVTGTGVTFYNTGTASGNTAYQPISVNGGSGLELSAPTSDPYEGILFFEDRNPARGTSGTTNNFTSQTGSNVTGAFYFKSTGLSYTGGTAQTAYTIIVADTVKFVGSSTTNDNYGLDGSPIKTATLAE
jgi:Putative Flp pilus-assembly TadE/G-like